MGKNRQRKSSFFSFFNFFKGKRSQGGDDSMEETVHSRRIFPSDYDGKDGVVGDRYVDNKANIFIDKVREKNYKAL